MACLLLFFAGGGLLGDAPRCGAGSRGAEATVSLRNMDIIFSFNCELSMKYARGLLYGHNYNWEGHGINHHHAAARRAMHRESNESNRHQRGSSCEFKDLDQASVEPGSRASALGWSFIQVYISN